MEMMTADWMPILTPKYNDTPSCWKQPFDQQSLDEVQTLLLSGSEPNVAIGVFDNNVCRLLLSVETDEHVVNGGRYQRFKEQHRWITSIEQFAKQRRRTQNSARSRTQSDHDWKYIYVPLIDAARRRDNSLVQLLANHGARFDASIKRTSRMYRDKLLNPFLPVVQNQDHNILDVLFSLTELEGASVKIIRHWIADCLTHLLEIFKNEDPSQGTWNLWDQCLRKLLTLLLDYNKNVDGTYLARRMPQPIGKMPMDDTYDRFTAVLTGQLHHHYALEESPEAFNIATTDAILGASLHISIVENAFQMCRTVLGKGANSSLEVLGIPPLLEAVYRGHPDVVKALLDSGVDPNTALSGAVLDALDTVQSENEDFCQHNIAFRRFALRKWSGLHIAAYRGMSSILSLLIMSGSNLSRKDTEGASAIEVALRNNHMPTAFVLLINGCYPDIQLTPVVGLLEQAHKHGRRDLIEQLFLRGLIPSAEYQATIPLRQNRETANDTVLAPAAGSSPRNQQNAVHSPSRSVCTKCGDLLARSCGKGHRAFLEHQDATSSCDLCSVFQDHNETGYSCCYQLATRFSKNEETRAYILETELDGVLGCYTIRPLSVDWHNVLQRMHSLDDANTGSSAAMAMAQMWLRSCFEHHPQCSSNSLHSHSPTRVLDIGSYQGDKNIRLIQNVALTKPYVTLSHLWGATDLPNTTIANLEERLRFISCDVLSQTIRDAIYVVQGLGYQYLWVDVLCIIQDSRVDWLTESSKMSSVYSGAAFTIAVGNSSDHSQGMIRSRRARCVRPFHFDPPQSWPFRDHDTASEWYIFPSESSVLSAVRPKGLLDTRGWILQEQLLSPRILYYGNGELFWDCITVSASESSPVSSSLLMDDNPDETWALKLIRRSLVGGNDQGTLRRRISDVWVQVIKNYSARKLTKLSDKLIALDGILQLTENILGDSPVGGMWKPGLWYQLTWWIEQLKQPHTNTASAQFSAPSWSWLSSQRPVYYHNSLRGRKPMVDAKSHAFTELQPMLKIVSVESKISTTKTSLSGTLVIKSVFFRYRLRENDLKPTFWKRWNKAEVTFNSVGWLLDRAVKLPLEVHCVVVAEDSVDKLLVCLFGPRRRPSRTMEAYRRMPLGWIVMAGS